MKYFTYINNRSSDNSKINTKTREIANNISEENLIIPNGFIINTEAYTMYLQEKKVK